MDYLMWYPAIWIWGKNNNKLGKEADMQAHARKSSIVKADSWVLKLRGICGLYSETHSQNKIFKIWEAGGLLFVVSR